MINIMNSVTDYVKTLDLYTNLSIDSFVGNLEEILIRHEPSKAKVQTYMDGSRTGTFNFSIRAKSQDAEKAVDQLSSLITELDIKDDLELTNLIKIKIEPVTGVRYINKTEKLEFIYSTDFTLEYTAERSK